MSYSALIPHSMLGMLALLKELEHLAQFKKCPSRGWGNQGTQAEVERIRPHERVARH